MKPLILLLTTISCLKTFSQQFTQNITCTDSACYGKYMGPEFIKGSDVAHQFSNKMCHEVGEQLKILFQKKKYSKVDFENIKMNTIGMGKGHVTYSLLIPFKNVNTKCEAFTSFDHVGGWNHTPELAARKRQLSKALLPNDSLYISNLKTTSEGLQEYWIQWKNKTSQSMCE